MSGSFDKFCTWWSIIQLQFQYCRSFSYVQRMRERPSDDEFIQPEDMSDGAVLAKQLISSEGKWRIKTQDLQYELILAEYFLLISFVLLSQADCQYGCSHKFIPLILSALLLVAPLSFLLPTKASVCLFQKHCNPNKRKNSLPLTPLALNSENLKQEAN